MAAGPLSGVRIIDLTRGWAGPLATRILADLGAQVVKVEAATGRGPAHVPKDGRGVYPDRDPGERPWNRQGSFNKLNRNKQSVVLDLKTAEGRELVLRLVAESDVVIENMSARVMPALGLDYQALREANERIIYVAMPGFGLSGPYRDWVAYGPSLEPVSGLTSVMGYGPSEARVTSKAVPDAIAGVTAAAAVVTALHSREEHGSGALVELSQHEGAIAMIGEYFVEQELSGRQPERPGNGDREYSPHGTYRCRGDDEWIVIAARDQAEWQALCDVAGRGWRDDARFATVDGRREHRLDLDTLIEAWTCDEDKLQLTERLQAAGVPAGAVLSAPELLADRQLRERGFFVAIDHPDAGSVRYPGTPIVFDGRRADDWRPAPGLGEHNDAILVGLLGLSPDELRGLRARSIIADHPPD